MTEHYLSVSDLTRYLKRKFDQDPYLQRVYVVGEISSYRPRPNSHQYFALKDEHAKINVTLFKSQLAKIPFQLEEGMKVLALGQVTLYGPNGSYQLNIESLQPDGVGALYQALAQLKEKFQREGLFDKLNRPLPRYPKKIAVITSPSGAVIRDILTTIQRRYPIVQVTVFPSRVQGKEAVDDLIKAFQKLKVEASEYDLVILARGGGSIEDLWCFNDERLAHEILACPIPVISSIGHETDTSLSDLVADLRAPTPTAAAEMAVPVLLDLMRHLKDQEERILIGMTNQITYKKKRLTLSSQSRVLRQPQELYQPYFQKLDYLVEKLEGTQRRQLETGINQVERMTNRLKNQSPDRMIKEYQVRLNYLNQRTKQASQVLVASKQRDFVSQVRHLEAVSPLSTLSRGYAFVEHDGQVVKSVDGVEVGQNIQIRLWDGQVEAKVANKNHVEVGQDAK